MWKPKRSFIEFNGLRYFLEPSGRYRAGRYAGAQLLHRAIWEHRHGPIPSGMQVHHVDGDFTNNADENLKLMECGEHSRHHWSTPILKAGSCDYCGKPYQTIARSPTRWCSKVCQQRGRAPRPDRADYFRQWASRRKSA